MTWKVIIIRSQDIRSTFFESLQKKNSNIPKRLSLSSGRHSVVMCTCALYNKWRRSFTVEISVLQVRCRRVKCWVQKYLRNNFREKNVRAQVRHDCITSYFLRCNLSRSSYMCLYRRCVWELERTKSGFHIA